MILNVNNFCRLSSLILPGMFRDNYVSCMAFKNEKMKYLSVADRR